MTRIELAKKGIITDEMKTVALAEGISPEKLASDIAEGVTVITRNNLHDIAPPRYRQRSKNKDKRKHRHIKGQGLIR